MEKSLQKAVETYLYDLVAQLDSGHAKEHAYRPALQRLMESFDDVTAVNDPKRSEHGNPDFVFLKKSNPSIIRGYAEAKDVDKDLDVEERSEQMERYSGYANLYLTNYLEFRFFRNGEKYKTIVLAEVRKGKLRPDFAQMESFIRELNAFVTLPPEKITSGKRLAEIMGAKARRARDDVEEFIGEGDEDLRRIMDMIRDRLVPDIDPARFADMYAQTLVYGLFVARFSDRTPATFSRQEARDLVPKTNPFLRAFFDHIAGAEFDDRLGYIVDELCDVFRVSDVESIVSKHLKVADVTGADKDPIIHFYEDFLAVYDKTVKKALGAYYTPVPVVRFIIESVDRILRDHFSIAEGLASSETITYTPKAGTHRLSDGAKVVAVAAAQPIEIARVQILDPATGTATFLNETIKFIRQQFEGQEGRWPKYVEDNLLDRLYGFELMMAPYTVAHLKLGLTLAETGARDVKSRLNVFLTNTLQEGYTSNPGLFDFGLSEAVTEESRLASDVKDNKPIMVVMGNPPYSAASSNRTKYANKLVDKYKVEPGGFTKLVEDKTWLNDDYVKFIAFAEDMIASNGTGVVAMITNNGYLDNPTFRGMRWHLTKTFDEIYVLDLHGSANKKETAPDGSKDDNIFNIRQGVGIIVAVKSTTSDNPGRVFHSEMYGKRADKFSRLLSHDVSWTELDLDKEFLLFVPRSTEGKEEWDAGIPVDELFRVGSTGILTSGDSFIIDRDKSAIKSRVAKLIKGEFNAAEMTKQFGLGKAYAPWVIGNRDKLKMDESKLVPIGYRPFDIRFTYFDNRLLWRWREEVMSNFLKPGSIGLVTTRLQKENPGALVTNVMVGHKVFNSYDSNSVFPLYLDTAEGKRVSNLDARKLAALSKNLKSAPAPEAVLDYVYGVLYSPTYRKKNADFLKSGFPRIPIPDTDKKFEDIARAGEALRKLHLFQTKLATSTIFSIAGDDKVEKVEYREGSVYINATQYFGGVSETAWNLFIGGYRPAFQWLKDRSGTTLSNDELTTYQRIISVLDETARLMSEVDHMDDQGD